MHIGERIQEEVKKQRLPVKEFAEALHIVRSNVYDIYTRRTIDTDLLRRISKILQHDFFKDLSEDYYGTTKEVDNNSNTP